MFILPLLSSYPVCAVLHHSADNFPRNRTTLSILGWDPNMSGTSISVGELNANCEAKIMADDETTELGPKQRGEIWVRAPNIMRGYWRKPEATKETLTPDGWLKTGDIGYVDDSGMFFIVDRKKVSFASCCAIMQDCGVN